MRASSQKTRAAHPSRSGKTAKAKPKSSAADPKRVRRSAEDARRLILDAAEARLIRLGPEGIRLQDIAADIGISHPAILHHFDSREGLMRALIERGTDELRERILTALRDADPRAEEIIGKVFEIMSDRGTARLLAWLTMTGRSTLRDARHSLMTEIAEHVHARRVSEARSEGRTAPEMEDTLFRAILVASAAIGDAVAGHQLAETAGLDKAGVSRFRMWLAHLLSERARN